MCNGLVHVFADNFDEIHLVCKKHNVKTVSHLYEDYKDKIRILPVENEFQDVVDYANKNNLKICRVGFEHCDYNAFEESFYKQFNLNPDLEFTNFRLPNNLEPSKLFYNNLLTRLGKNYIIVHSISSYKAFDLKIESNLPRHTVDKTDTDDILDYVDTICNAKEVHIINSGLHNLVFQLFVRDMIKTKDVYYHNARKAQDGGIPIRIPEGIKVVEYE